MRTRRCSSPISSWPQVARARKDTDAGHGRIEERSCRAAEANGSLNATPTGKVCVPSPPSPPGASKEARRRKPRYPLLHHVPRPRPEAVLAATRARSGVESFHWTLDVTFDEHRYPTRKDASALNFAVIRHTG